MTPQDFEFLSKILKDRSGIFLTKEKEYLLDTRLQPIARQRGVGDISGYVTFLKSHPSDEAAYKELVEAMTTNESMFFRDMTPFNALKQTILPDLVSKGSMTKRLRIWNAACSNGQEPYSVLITLLEEAHKMAGFAYDMIGTDIDSQVLDKAKKGVYTQFEVQRGMPIQLLLKYFTQKDGNCWEVKSELRNAIQYRQLNLLDSFMSMGRFDIIFCRNVLIYFDAETKKDIVERLCQCLNPNGYLLLGSSETIMNITDKLKPIPSGGAGIFTHAA